MIRFAQKHDHPQLKTLWAEAFGDSQAEVDAYFTYRHADENMLVYSQYGNIAGMLSMLPVTLCANDGQTYRARYIYAVATHEDFRRQGVSAALLEAAHTHMKSIHEAAAVLVPATQDLFSYYEKRGYKTAFSLDVLTVCAEDLPPSPPRGTFSACSAGEYTRLRDQAFHGSSLYVRWEDRAVAYAVQTFAKTGGVTSLSWKDGYGCAAWEKNKDGVLVRELAMISGDVHTALAVLHQELNAKRYMLRLAQGTIPNVTPQSFGMIHWLIPEPQLSGKPPYLSLAMD